MAEVYVSTDVEADGPVPGPFSMLSFGSAAYDGTGALLSTFARNLDTLDGATADPDTAAWWARHPEAWEASRTDCQDPALAMPEYVAWLKNLGGAPVFVGFPAAYDFMFVYWYLIRFAGESPFSFSALDIKTLAMTALGGAYRKATKRNMPRRWFAPRTPGTDQQPHTHVAVQDALEQGNLFFAIMDELRARRSSGPDRR